MKLPSLTYLAQHAKQSLLRFPLSMLSALIAVCAGIYLTEVEKEITNVFPFVNIMLCAGLGIPFYFCATVFANNKDFGFKAKTALNILATIIIVLLYFTLPNIDSTQNTSLPYIRYALYNITIHLLVSFIPFIGSDDLNGFWHYNKILFLRILTSLLYSGFLYAGLSLALVALHLLFDIDIHEELYLDLFIFIIGFFNTWFFISGIPKTFSDLEGIKEYPKGLKVFSQFVLLPLLILYLVILYGYAGKITFLWNWPKGIVSYLIVCVSVLGILTLLLIHPYGNLQGNAWIKKFSRIYYFILFPLVVILFVAIGMRLSDYGITINRYIILVLGVWLTLVCAYFMMGKTNIKFIPISLAILSTLISFGYWGVFSVSERSQVNRLKQVLENGKILQSGKIQNEVIWLKDSLPTLFTKKEDTNEGLLSDSLHNEVKSIMDYLDSHHGFTPIRGWYGQDIDSIAKLKSLLHPKWSRVSEDEIYMRSMGLKYQYLYSNNSTHYYFNYSVLPNNVTFVHGYDYMFSFNENPNYEEMYVDSFSVDSILFTLHYPNKSDNQLMLVNRNDSIRLNLGDLMNALISKHGKEYKYDLPVSDMSLIESTNKLAVKMELNSMGLSGNYDSLSMHHLSGKIFLRIKN